MSVHRLVDGEHEIEVVDRVTDCPFSRQWCGVLQSTNPAAATAPLPRTWSCTCSNNNPLRCSTKLAHTAVLGISDGWERDGMWPDRRSGYRRLQNIRHTG